MVLVFYVCVCRLLFVPHKLGHCISPWKIYWYFSDLNYNSQITCERYRSIKYSANRLKNVAITYLRHYSGICLNAHQYDSNHVSSRYVNELIVQIASWVCQSASLICSSVNILGAQFSNSVNALTLQANTTVMPDCFSSVGALPVRAAAPEKKRQFVCSRHRRMAVQQAAQMSIPPAANSRLTPSSTWVHLMMQRLMESIRRSTFRASTLVITAALWARLWEGPVRSTDCHLIVVAANRANQLRHHRPKQTARSPNFRMVVWWRTGVAHRIVAVRQSQRQINWTQKHLPRVITAVANLPQ